MVKFRDKDINLKISKKELEDGKVQLTITVPGNATADLLRGATFALAMQNKIDVQNTKPEDLDAVVLEKVGEAQFNAFANHYAMTLLAPFAISEKQIEPIMEPEVSTNAQIASGKDFVFVAIVWLKPSYNLSSYGPVSIKLRPITVTEEEIDEQIQNLAQRSVTTAEDKGAAVGPESEIVIALETKFADNGESIEHLTAERRIYSLGTGFLPEDFDKQIIGMKAGESRTFDFELPGIPNPDDTPGEPRTVSTTVTLTQVNQRILPAITNAWVEAHIPEAKTVEGLREMLRAQGMEFKAKEQENMKYFLVASALAERFEGFISDEIYEYTRGDMLGNLSAQLKQQNMTLEQYVQNMGMDQQQFNMNFMLQVRETLRQSFALDALARNLKLTLTDEDIEDTLKRMAPGNEERARAEIMGTGRSYLLTEAALRTKANKWLADTATFEYE